MLAKAKLLAEIGKIAAEIYSLILGTKHKFLEHGENSKVKALEKQLAELKQRLAAVEQKNKPKPKKLKSAKP